MKKFRVHGLVTVAVFNDVEAESEKNAIRVADAKWDDLSNYASIGQDNVRLFAPKGTTFLSTDETSEHPVYDYVREIDWEEQ